jgi:hypothetical protein
MGAGMGENQIVSTSYSGKAPLPASPSKQFTSDGIKEAIIDSKVANKRLSYRPFAIDLISEMETQLNVAWEMVHTPGEHDEGGSGSGSGSGSMKSIHNNHQQQAHILRKEDVIILGQKDG